MRGTSRNGGETERAGAVDALLPFLAGPAVVLPIFPGFLLCMPGLVLAAVLLIPVVLVAVAAGIAFAAVSVLGIAARAARRGLSAAAGASGARDGAERKAGAGATISARG